MSTRRNKKVETTDPPTVKDWERFVDFIRSSDTKSVREWFRQRECPESKGWGSQFPEHLSDPVFVAASVGNFVIFDLLLYHGFPPDKVTRSKHRAAQPIHMAASRGHLKMVKTLIDEYEIPVDTEGRSYKTPLYHAVSEDHTQVAKYLVSRGADVNHLSRYCSSSPFVMTVQNQHFNLAEVMLKHGANINCEAMSKGCALINYYVECGNLPIVQWLYSNGARTDIRGETNGYSIFHYALKSVVQPYILKFLIDINVPLNVLTPRGHSPLYEALCVSPLRTINAECLDLMFDAGYHFTKMEYKKACEQWQGDANSLLLSQLMLYVSHPRSLKELCCFTIRGNLGSNLHKFVDDSPLPALVKDYLKLVHVVRS